MSHVVGYIWSQPGDDSFTRVAAEEAAIRAYCDVHGLDLSEALVDAGEQGAALERPQMKTIVERDGCTVVVASLASLGRRFHDVATVLTEFNHRDVRLVSVQENLDTGRPDGQQLLKLFVTIPQVASWVRAPKPQAAAPKVFVRSREVLHNGGTCPYGYSLDEATNQFVVSPLEAAVVQRIFRERAAGRSLRQIANDLTRDGLPTKRGGRWQANTVKTILENLFYTGDYQCQNRIYPDDHEAVISRELFEQVNQAREILQVC
ncbi:MAG: recombinase family protein [bacterium]|jgi:hypothetical protein|nr:recombinase family protein [bacterium]